MRSFEYYKDLIITLTQKELKVRYKRNVLGYLWSVAHPLLLAVVFFIAFKVVIRIDLENYALFLITAMFPWQWFSNSLNVSPSVFIGNASLIKKVTFPREIMVAVAVLNDMLHFVFSLPVIAGFLFFYGLRPDVSWLWGVPLFLAVQFSMTFGLSLLFSTLNLFFRDMERLVVIFTTFVFYFTPIIYSEAMVPEKYRVFLKLNPIAPLMVGWRELLMHGSLDFGQLGLSALYSSIMLAVGYAVFARLRWRFAEVL